MAAQSNHHAFYDVPGVARQQDLDEELRKDRLMRNVTVPTKGKGLPVHTLARELGVPISKKEEQEEKRRTTQHKSATTHKNSTTSGSSKPSSLGPLYYQVDSSIVPRDKKATLQQPQKKLSPESNNTAAAAAAGAKAARLSREHDLNLLQQAQANDEQLVDTENSYHYMHHGLEMYRRFNQLVKQQYSQSSFYPKQHENHQLGEMTTENNTFLTNVVASEPETAGGVAKKQGKRGKRNRTPKKGRQASPPGGAGGAPYVSPYAEKRVKATDPTLVLRGQQGVLHEPTAAGGGASTPTLARGGNTFEKADDKAFTSATPPPRWENTKVTVQRQEELVSQLRAKFKRGPHQQRYPSRSPTKCGGGGAEEGALRTAVTSAGAIGGSEAEKNKTGVSSSSAGKSMTRATALPSLKHAHVALSLFPTADDSGDRLATHNKRGTKGTGLYHMADSSSPSGWNEGDLSSDDDEEERRRKFVEGQTSFVKGKQFTYLKKGDRHSTKTKKKGQHSVTVALTSPFENFAATGDLPPVAGGSPSAVEGDPMATSENGEETQATKLPPISKLASQVIVTNSHEEMHTKGSLTTSTPTLGVAFPTTNHELTSQRHKKELDRIKARMRGRTGNVAYISSSSPIQSDNSDVGNVASASGLDSGVDDEDPLSLPPLDPVPGVAGGGGYGSRRTLAMSLPAAVQRKQREDEARLEREQREQQQQETWSKVSLIRHQRSVVKRKKEQEQEARRAQRQVKGKRKSSVPSAGYESLHYAGGDHDDGAIMLFGSGQDNDEFGTEEGRTTSSGINLNDFANDDDDDDDDERNLVPRRGRGRRSSMSGSAPGSALSTRGRPVRGIVKDEDGQILFEDSRSYRRKENESDDETEGKADMDRQQQVVTVIDTSSAAMEEKIKQKEDPPIFLASDNPTQRRRRDSMVQQGNNSTTETPRPTSFAFTRSSSSGVLKGEGGTTSSSSRRSSLERKDSVSSTTTSSSNFPSRTPSETPHQVARRWSSIRHPKDTQEDLQHDLDKDELLKRDSDKEGEWQGLVSGAKEVESEGDDEWSDRGEDSTPTSTNVSRQSSITSALGRKNSSSKVGANKRRNSMPKSGIKAKTGGAQKKGEKQNPTEGSPNPENPDKDDEKNDKNRKKAAQGGDSYFLRRMSSLLQDSSVKGTSVVDAQQYQSTRTPQSTGLANTSTDSRSNSARRRNSSSTTTPAPETLTLTEEEAEHQQQQIAEEEGEDSRQEEGGASKALSDDDQQDAIETGSGAGDADDASSPRATPPAGDVASSTLPAPVGIEKRKKSKPMSIKAREGGKPKLSFNSGRRRTAKLQAKPYDFSTRSMQLKSHHEIYQYLSSSYSMMDATERDYLLLPTESIVGKPSPQESPRSPKTRAKQGSGKKGSPQSSPPAAPTVEGLPADDPTAIALEDWGAQMDVDHASNVAVVISLTYPGDRTKSSVDEYMLHMGLRGDKGILREGDDEAAGAALGADGQDTRIKRPPVSNVDAKAFAVALRQQGFYVLEVDDTPPANKEEADKKILPTRNVIYSLLRSALANVSGSGVCLLYISGRGGFGSLQGSSCCVSAANNPGVTPELVEKPCHYIFASDTDTDRLTMNNVIVLDHLASICRTDTSSAYPTNQVSKTNRKGGSAKEVSGTTSVIKPEIPKKYPLLIAEVDCPRAPIHGSIAKTDCPYGIMCSADAAVGGDLCVRYVSKAIASNGTFLNVHNATGVQDGRGGGKSKKSNNNNNKNSQQSALTQGTRLLHDGSRNMLTYYLVKALTTCLFKPDLDLGPVAPEQNGNQTTTSRRVVSMLEALPFSDFLTHHFTMTDAVTMNRLGLYLHENLDSSVKLAAEMRHVKGGTSGNAETRAARIQRAILHSDAFNAVECNAVGPKEVQNKMAKVVRLTNDECRNRPPKEQDIIRQRGSLQQQRLVFDSLSWNLSRLQRDPLIQESREGAEEQVHRQFPLRVQLEVLVNVGFDKSTQSRQQLIQDIELYFHSFLVSQAADEVDRGFDTAGPTGGETPAGSPLQIGAKKKPKKQKDSGSESDGEGGAGASWTGDQLNSTLGGSSNPFDGGRAKSSQRRKSKLENSHNKKKRKDLRPLVTSFLTSGHYVALVDAESFATWTDTGAISLHEDFHRLCDCGLAPHTNPQVPRPPQGVHTTVLKSEAAIILDVSHYTRIIKPTRELRARALDPDSLPDTVTHHDNDPEEIESARTALQVNYYDKNLLRVKGSNLSILQLQERVSVQLAVHSLSVYGKLVKFLRMGRVAHRSDNHASSIYKDTAPPPPVSPSHGPSLTPTRASASLSPGPGDLLSSSGGEGNSPTTEQQPSRPNKMDSRLHHPFRVIYMELLESSARRNHCAIKIQAWVKMLFRKRHFDRTFRSIVMPHRLGADAMFSNFLEELWGSGHPATTRYTLRGRPLEASRGGRSAVEAEAEEEEADSQATRPVVDVSGLLAEFQKSERLVLSRVEASSRVAFEVFEQDEINVLTRRMANNWMNEEEVRRVELQDSLDRGYVSISENLHRLFIVTVLINPPEFYRIAKLKGRVAKEEIMKRGRIEVIEMQDRAKVRQQRTFARPVGTF